MALQEFTGKLDETPKLKEFTGNLDGTSSTLGEVTAANYLKSVKERQAKDESSATLTDNLRDIVAAALKIGPTAVKGVADIGRLATGDTVGVDTSNAMRRGMDAIDQVIGSSALNAQKANINQALQDPNVGIADMPGVILNNPRAAADTAVSAVGSMFLPTGAAVGATKALPTIAKVFPRLAGVAPGAVATGTTVGTSALQNASETFTGTADQSLPERYKGAAISGAASLVLGKILDGGVEGVIARRMAGESGVRGSLNIANSAAKTGAKEFLQEGGEESANYIGQQVATNQPIDPNAMGKQGVYGGIVGLGVGGVADVATNLPVRQSPAQSTEPTAADYEAAVQKIFGTGQAPAAPVQQASVSTPQAAQIDPAVPAPQQEEQAPQQTIQSLASLIANTATQESPLNVPTLTPVADDIQLDKEPVNNGAANVLQPVDSSTTGSGAPIADTSVAAPQRVRDAGELDLTGNGTTEPAVRTAPLETDGQRAQQDAPANPQPAADVAGQVTQPATPVATGEGAGGSQPSQVAPTPAATPKASTGYIGQDGMSIDEGGKPFATKVAAQKAKKLQPMMRVKKVEGGFVLADKTPAQLAAEAKAAKRISGANTEAGTRGRPMAAHEFIASRGGMAPSERSDLGIEGNVKIGNRWLFAGAGKGMTIAQATEALQEAGYLNEDSHNAAYDLIKRSVSNPQYTYEGWDRIAELEMQTQFEDYLAQQNEAEDPFGPLDASDYTGDTGYEPASEELQAEVRALIEQLEAAGIDTELLIDDAVRENVNKSDEEYYDSAKQKLTNALTQNARSGSNEPNSGNAQGQQGQEAVDGSRADSSQVDGQPSNEGATSEAGQEGADQGLTSYTPQEIEDRLAKLEKAEQERKQQEREAEQKAQADAERDTFTLTGSDRAADVAEAQGQNTLFDIKRSLKVKRPDGYDQTQTQEFKRWSNDAPLVTGQEAESYGFKTGEKVVLEAFHGTKRPDRVGTKFLKKRATSGPMAYHTSDPTLASSYASGKEDTSLGDDEQDYANWFKYKPKGQRTPTDIVRAWYSLDADTKAKIAETAPTLRLNDELDGVVVEDGNTRGNGSYDYNLSTTRTSYNRQGNPLKALVEDWLNSGNLFNNEEVFMDVLRKAGFPMEDVAYDSPFAAYPFVYKNYIAMQKPLVTSDIPQSVVDALNAAAKSDRSRAKQTGADMWDKRTRTMRDWVAEFNKTDNKYVWTSIPDTVTNLFKSLGYDGIIDWSGKGGGTSYPVYIPFEETQVKSAIGNKGTFDSSKNDILKDISGFNTFNPFTRLPETARTNVLAKLKALEKNLDAGKIDADKYREGMQDLIERIQQRNETQLDRAVAKGRERGPEWITERLMRAKRKGELSEDTVNFALWALAKNPALANDLGISLPEGKNNDASGDYNPASRVMRLFKSSASPTTAVHEILHHTERMMPVEIQNGILKEYQKAWDAAWAKADEKTQKLMQDMLAASAGDAKAKERVMAGFSSGALKYDDHYQLYNASEFWAVNATDILAKRYAVEGSWVAKAKRWLAELVQYMKGALGLRSDAPILKAINAVMEGNGERITNVMLNESEGVLNDPMRESKFAKWFGKSKVLDDDGKPLVVYHGTQSPWTIHLSKEQRLDEFDKYSAGAPKDVIARERGYMERGGGALWFSNSESVADGYADGGEVLSAYLKIEKPLDLRPDIVGIDAVQSILKEAGLDEASDEYGWDMGVARAIVWDNTKLIEYARNNGFDGLIYPDTSISGSRTHTSYVALNPGQVKSAIVNNGNYDPTNPSIVEDIKRQDNQTELDLNEPGFNFEPIDAKDAFSTVVDAAGRKQWTLGKKLYDRMATVATDYLGRVKLADNRPAEFKQMMRQFRVDQNKATESAKAIAEKGMDLTPEQRVLLSDMIENQVKVGDVPPQEMVELAASITAALETQARDLVELGMLSEDRLVKDYLPRLYKTPLVAQLTNKQMFMSWFTKTRMKIRGARLQSRGLVNEVPIEKVKLAEKFGWKVSSLADGDNLPQNLLDVLNSGGKIPAKYNGTKIVMWRDFTESERQDMGEVRDAVLRYAMGYVETQRDVAIGRLFKAVANNPDLAKTYNPGGWVPVPNTEIKGAPGTKTYGSLAGMYVEPQVADSLKRNTQPKGVLMAAYDKALGWWKEGKTVWNPVSHGNNVVSNIFVMHFAGLNPANPANWRNTVREYRTKGQYYKEAVDKGLFGTEWATMEIQNLLMPDLADMADIESVASSRVSKMAEFLKKTGKPVSWYRENMQRAYEFEDQFFKLMIYSDRRKAGMTPEEAIEDTERYIFNYADLPEGVEIMKRTPLPLPGFSPFFSYTYKAVPMLIHTAMTRPDRLVAPIALLAGANWLGYLISGGDEDKERKGLPDYMQGRSGLGTQKAIRMPFNVEGKPAFMDVTRRVPLGDLFDIQNQTNGLPIPAPFMPSHPLLTMSAAIAWNVDTFSGKDLVKKSDTAWEAAQTRAGYVYKQLTPNAPFVPGSYNFNKLMDSAAYTFDTELGPYTGRTKAGDPVPLSTTLPDVFTGTKIRAVDPERGIEYKRSDIAKEVREIQANIRSANRNQSMTADSRERYNQEQRDKLDELRKQREALQ